MNNFMGENFLLSGNLAEELYNLYAKNQPIIDYHCHLDPEVVFRNEIFTNIGELWLAHDHYKWRAMRQNGVPEHLITGDAEWKDKFKAFASTIPYMIGHPVYHWTHMELAEIFHILKPLSPETADDVWEKANEYIAATALRPSVLLEKFRVESLCTTDDPADSLQWHDGGSVRPAFRPDRCAGIAAPGFRQYIDKLSQAADVSINNFDRLLDALVKRLDFFGSKGCKVADHGIGLLPVIRGSYDDAAAAFNEVIRGGQVSQEQEQKYQDYMLRFFAGQYSKRDWTMQLHLSPLRNVNSRLFNALGPDCGIDTTGDPVSAAVMSRILDDIEKECGLPKLICYSLNSGANDVIINLLGSFSRDIPGKMQLGSAWWFSDHLDGIRSQLRLTASSGLLGRFIGMLTDSRSLTSYVRFDYFRRILCSEIAGRVSNGEYPLDMKWLGTLISGISYTNAKNYFNF